MNYKSSGIYKSTLITKHFKIDRSSSYIYLRADSHLGKILSSRAIALGYSEFMSNGIIWSFFADSIYDSFKYNPFFS